MEMPRPEYPRPQFVRNDWLCLNGDWQFEIDAGDSGLERGLVQRELSGKITVPFCPESSLSGIGNTDFMPAVWYRREVRVPEEWSGRNVLLHFQAVDYDATVWVNGKEVKRHRGGFTPFCCDLSGAINAGETFTLVLRARDDSKPPQPRGKQAQKYHNHDCLYTRTTGIWQSVWMEPVPKSFLKRPRISPDLGHNAFHLDLPIQRARPGQRVRAVLSDKEGEIVAAHCAVVDFTPKLSLHIPASRVRVWSNTDPHLYDLKIELLESTGDVIDTLDSYAGLRSVTLDGMAVRINGNIVFQKLILDQGYYPDGLMTAPSEQALVRDIELSFAAGFNGARLHQKVFEERFLYHCDKMGYLVWGEFGDWGCRADFDDKNQQQPGPTYITQWLEALERDYAHPSIIGWCPLNETWQRLHDRTTVLDDVTRGMFLATKAMDGTRPVIDASGYAHRVPETDIYDSHDYAQDADKLRANYLQLADGKPFINYGVGGRPWSVPYEGQPFWVSEFGGIWWNPDAKPGENSWGYGDRPKSLDEFYERFERLCAVLLDHPQMFGYCYTQLTDVFQEQNGIYHFDRSEKFDMERIRKAQQRPAAIEQAETVSAGISAMAENGLKSTESAT
jgi:beta-galactosidase/beta-glucuronidase